MNNSLKAESLGVSITVSNPDCWQCGHFEVEKFICYIFTVSPELISGNSLGEIPIEFLISSSKSFASSLVPINISD